MIHTLQVASLCTVVAALPILVHRSRIPLNPAFWLFLTVAWGVFVKTLYMVLLRNEPNPGTPDRIWGEATSPDYFHVGAYLALAALVAYVAAYFLVGNRGVVLSPAAWRAPHLADHAMQIAVATGGVCLAGLVMYLYMSGTNPLAGPLSAKRFEFDDIASASRFSYLPYYFFRLALLSGPLAYASVFCAARAEKPIERRRFKRLFGAAFVFALLLCHFASLRLVIVLLLLQIALLLFYLRARELQVLAGGLAVLTIASLIAITFLYRPYRVPDSRDASAVTAVSTQASAPRQAEAQGSALALLGRRIIAAPLEGRYLMDVSKLAHIAHHFPQQVPHLRGGAVFGALGPSSTLVAPATGERMTLDRYIGGVVFAEGRNSVPPGFAGELYIDFGLAGLVVGFLTLGAFHRLVYNQLAASTTPPILAAALVIVLLDSTVVLVNSGLLPAVSRSVLEIGMLVLVCAPWIVTRLAGR